ncbi:MAG: 50S ribosomal protein L25 [Deltaproteobacteria bacterium]|nr:50S ribosomal protein L25 [Deltaproteobacteria bacterium]
MEHIINVEPRTGAGKGASRKLRARGLIPAVLYGHKEKTEHLAVDPKALEKAVERSGFGRNTIFRLQGGSREVMALLRETQVNRLRRQILHVDFIEIRDTDEIQVSVPYTTVGKPAGVTAGGILQSVVDRIELACKPGAIPRSIELNVEKLEIGQSVHIGDVMAPPGTRVLGNPKLPVITVYAPRAVEEVAATPAEGAVAAAAAAPAPEPEKKEKK